MKRTLLDFLGRTGEDRGISGDDWKVFPRLRVLEDPDAGLLVQDHPWADTRIPGYNEYPAGESVRKRARPSDSGRTAKE